MREYRFALLLLLRRCTAVDIPVVVVYGRHRSNGNSNGDSPSSKEVVMRTHQLLGE